MSLSSINSEKGKGGLGQKLPGQDHITGMIFYHNTLPAGFGTEKIKNIVDVPSAEALGIVDDKSDETQATGAAVEITQAASIGSVEKITMDTVVIGEYVVIAGNTTADIASGLVNAVNNGTSGYTAILNGSTVQIAPPIGLGASINGGTHLAYSTTSGGSATVTQFSGGVDAFFDVIHYHVSEFYRINPKGELYVMIATVPTSYDFEEARTLQNFTEGKIRQIGILHHLQPFATTYVTAMQAIAKTIETEKKPLSIVYGADISGITDLTTLPNLTALDAEKVSVVIAQDGNNVGAALAALRGYSITALGAVMGDISLSSVHENIGWVGKFKPSEVELDVAAFANKQLLTAIGYNLQDQIDTKGYIFLRKHLGKTGSYWNYSYTCTASTSDYNTIEKNRTIDKAIRDMRTNLADDLNSPVSVNPDTGYLDADFVDYLEGKAEKPLKDMQKAGELSGYSVFINPQQDVLSTSEIIITIKLIIKGVAKTITLKVGYALKIA